VAASAVFKNEPFRWNRFDPENSLHDYVDEDPGELRGAWTIWKFEGGIVTGEYMPQWEIDRVMERTPSRDKKNNIVGPWITDKPEMAKKTVIRRHFKLAPVSVEDERMSKAVMAENIAIGEGPDAQKQFFLPDLSPPEPEYTVEDFDKEFSAMKKDPHFKNYWALAVNHHRDTLQMSEDELKVDVMRSGLSAFRDQFQKYVDAKEAKRANAQKKKGTQKKTAAKNKTATMTQKQAKEFEELVKSDLWQRMTAYKEMYEDIYKEESGGKDPRTFKDCEDLCDRMKARIEALEDDIPAD
jgi:hypothetical protein